MTFTIGIIEDCQIFQELTSDVLKNDRIRLLFFNSPKEFLMRQSECDLVISDWSFGHVTLGFFLKEFDKSKLIILSGSVIVVNVECVAVLHKLDLAKLPAVVDFYIKRTRSF